MNKRRKMAARFGVITWHTVVSRGRIYRWPEGRSTLQEARALRPLGDEWVSLGYTTEVGE